MTSPAISNQPSAVSTAPTAAGVGPHRLLDFRASGHLVAEDHPQDGAVCSLRCTTCALLLGEESPRGPIGTCRVGHFRMPGTGINRWIRKATLLNSPPRDLVATAAACADYQPLDMEA